MKIRIIERNGIFIPQFYKKGYYGQSSWTGFGTPNVKFNCQKSALQFADLIEKSIPPIAPKGSSQKIVFKNFKDSDL